MTFSARPALRALRAPLSKAAPLLLAAALTLLGACGAAPAERAKLRAEVEREPAPLRASGRLRGVAATRVPVRSTGLAATPSAYKPLMADAERFGAVDVKLYPVENVATGTPQLVTFGLPFPRGSITQAGLSRVRVFNANGIEIPAYVEQLTPWRHLSNPALDGASVRIARVQLKYTFSKAYPNAERIRIDWGYADRTQSLASLENPRNGWQSATSGSFVAADGVSEPKVYAVLPASLLSRGLLKFGPMRPFATAVSETRDDPAAMDATEHYPEYQEQMYASKNFFFAHINEDDARVTAANQTPYKTDSEPWLYDRVTAFYGLHFRSGSFKTLREAVRAAEFYRIKLYPAGTVPDAAVGAFRLKSPDPAAYIGSNGTMYCYPEGLAYTHWLTGDEQAKDGAKLAAKAHEDAGDEPDRWSPTSSYTERHVGMKLMAHAIAYELFGDAPYKTGATKTWRERVQTISANLVWHQNGAGGALPANRVDGGLWKYGSQEGNGPADQLLVSFWQTPFMIDAMIRVYALSDDPAIAQFIRRTGNALKYGAKSYGPTQRDWYTNAPENLRLVDYVTMVDGSTYAADGVGPEHALSVAGAMAWAYYFSKVTGQQDNTLAQAAKELYRSYDYETNDWTRPDAPASGLSAYRNTPWRRYNWTYRTSGSLSWCLSDMVRVRD